MSEPIEEETRTSRTRPQSVGSETTGKSATEALPPSSRRGAQTDIESARLRIESELRALLAEGNLKALATRLLREYGPEILGLLFSLFRDQSAAEEVFSAFTENLWCGLPTFRGQCSFRTWTYTLARNCAHAYRISPYRRKRTPLAEFQGFEELEEQVRTETRVFLRTEVKDKFHTIRQKLDQDDQLLLILRVDRNLSWSEIAQIIPGETPHEAEAEPEAMDEAALRKRAAMLRKRYERVKDTLRSELAKIAM